MLEAVGVEQRFGEGPSAVWALRGVDVQIPDGSFTAIMGPSGSGKTTLLYCMSGILTPTAGQVLFNDDDIARKKRRALDELRRTSFGFVFQSYNLVEALSASQNVSLPSLFGGESVDRDDAVAALNRVGLDGLGDRYPSQLSGGQRQRVAIARAMAVKRRILFADEPTGALDSTSGAEVMEQLSTVAETGASIVLVTHDPKIAAYASRVVFLYDGRVADSVESADAAEISARLASLETH